MVEVLRILLDAQGLQVSDVVRCRRSQGCGSFFSAVQGELELLPVSDGQLDELELLLIINAFPLRIGQLAVFLQKRFQVTADLPAVKLRVFPQLVGRKSFQHGLAKSDKKGAAFVLLPAVHVLFELFP